MARPKKNLKPDSKAQLPAPRVRHLFHQQPFYLPQVLSPELEEWLNALSTMQIQHAHPVLLTPVEEYRLTNGEAILHFACHYIVKKKWDRHHPLPRYSNTIKSLLSYFAEIWFCTLELCIQCRDFLPLSELRKFPRASDWFTAIILEHRQVGLKIIRLEHQNYLQKRSKPHTEPKQPTKHENVPAMRAFLRELSKFGNPYSQEEEPQMHFLIEVSRGLAKDSPHFHTKYWQPYLKSIGEYIKKIELDNRLLVTQERNGYPVAHTVKRSVTPLGRFF